MKKFYFIRHGLSVLNAEGRFAGRIDTPLTTEGQAQAKRTGQDVLNSGIKVDVIVSSPLSRALETAQIVAEQIGYPKEDILEEELLVERDFGEGEGTVWSPERRNTVFAGMETDEVLVARARKALDWIESLPHDNVLVVGHGGIGRALRSLVKDDFPMSHPHQLGNAKLHEWV